MNKLEVWTLEWSEKQQCFHVDFLENTLKRGLDQFSEKKVFGDWVLLGVFDKHEMVHESAEKLRKFRNIPTLSEKFFKD